MSGNFNVPDEIFQSLKKVKNKDKPKTPDPF